MKDDERLLDLINSDWALADMAFYVNTTTSDFWIRINIKHIKMNPNPKRTLNIIFNILKGCKTFFIKDSKSFIQGKGAPSVKSSFTSGIGDHRCWKCRPALLQIETWGDRTQQHYNHWSIAFYIFVHCVSCWWVEVWRPDEICRQNKVEFDVLKIYQRWRSAPLVGASTHFLTYRWWFSLKRILFEIILYVLVNKEPYVVIKLIFK